MNSKVIKRMMRFKVTVHHVVSTSSLGDKVSEVFDVMGYFQENIILVLNRLGRQETSSAQVYLTGEDIQRIDPSDRIDISIPVKVPKDEKPDEDPTDPNEPEPEPTEPVDPIEGEEGDDESLGDSSDDANSGLALLDADETEPGDTEEPVAPEEPTDPEEPEESEEPVEPSPEEPEEPEELEVQYELLWKDRPILKKDVFFRPNAIADVGVLYLP